MAGRGIAAADMRVAVVGCGYWGKNLVRNFAELGALEALVDAHAPTVEGLIAKHGGRALTFDQALADPRVHALAIAAPAPLHYALAKRGMEAGKDVFVEKPVAMEVAEAEALLALSVRLDRRLMVGHLLQYHPAFLALLEAVRGGLIGRVTYAYSNRLSLGKVRREEDVLWSFAPHDLSMLLAVMGEAPDSVTASGAPTLHPTIGDVVQVQLGFPSGARAHVFASWLHPFKEQRLVVIGERGALVFEDSQADAGRKLVHYPHAIEWANGAPAPVKGEARPLPFAGGEPLKLECAHFLDCVASGATPRTDGAEGLRVLGVLARASAALKAPGGSVATSSADLRLVTASATSRAAGSPGPRVVGEHPGVTIHESAYVDADVRIGEGSKIWHFSHILGKVTLGRRVNVGQNVVIGPKVTIGDNVKIQNNVSVYEGVELEDGVFCGPSCVFTNVNNPRAEVERKAEYRRTLVKRGASIGANATIVCGHTLGAYSFVAAGAVVAKDVPDHAMVAGVPARRIGWMSHAGVKLTPDPAAPDTYACAETGRRYRQTAPDRLEEIA